MSRRIRFTEKSAKIPDEATGKQNKNKYLNEDQNRENLRRSSGSRQQSSKFRKGGKNSNTSNKIYKPQGGELTNQLWEERNRSSSKPNAKDRKNSRISKKRYGASSQNIGEHNETIQPVRIGTTLILSVKEKQEITVFNIPNNFFGISKEGNQQIILVKELNRIVETNEAQADPLKEKNCSFQQFIRVFSEESIRVFTRGFYKLIGKLLVFGFWLIILLIILFSHLK